ncbi:MAG TPA: hypothetical protein VMM38_08930 [Aridibacter sp.]|nr:hypothetical protein [Aridibacter sp.]
MDVRILTLVTNFNGTGPGHSAVAVGEMVFTFEDATNGWLQSGSGWKKVKYETYLGGNKHRPVLAQTIRGASPDSVTKYVDRSIANDDDYLGSGVCSQQVAKAINYSLPHDIDFDPKGFDTPFGVYHCARRLKVVIGEEYTWPGRASLTVGVWASIVNKLKVDYPDAHKSMDFSR